jgi:hypothetical protein
VGLRGVAIDITHLKEAKEELEFYRSDDLSKVDFGTYMKSLVVYLLYSYPTDKRSIELCLGMDQILLGVGKAIPCDLITNKMISNCRKYAFPEGSRGRK